MFRKILMLSLASITLLGGAASAITVSASTGSGTSKVSSGLVSFNSARATVTGYNNGSNTSGHGVYEQINYWPDRTVSHFNLSPSATYTVPVNLSSGRYYAEVSGSKYSQTKMVQ